jgi:hypothetical protein
MLELDDNLARACREFPLDARSTLGTEQCEMEHQEYGKFLKRWERKQKHRGEDVIRNPFKSFLQWHTEHNEFKRWERKQKHRWEDVIRNPFQSLDFAKLPTACGKMPVMPVDMLHNVPLGLWKHLLVKAQHTRVIYNDAELVFVVSHLKCDTEEGDLNAGKFVSRTKNVKQFCRCCVGSQCEAIRKRKRVPVVNWMRKSRQLNIEKQAMGSVIRTCLPHPIQLLQLWRE